MPDSPNTVPSPQSSSVHALDMEEGEDDNSAQSLPKEQDFDDFVSESFLIRAESNLGNQVANLIDTEVHSIDAKSNLGNHDFNLVDEDSSLIHLSTNAIESRLIDSESHVIDATIIPTESKANSNVVNSNFVSSSSTTTTFIALTNSNISEAKDQYVLENQNTQTIGDSTHFISSLDNLNKVDVSKSTDQVISVLQPKKLNDSDFERSYRNEVAYSAKLQSRMEAMSAELIALNNNLVDVTMRANEQASKLSEISAQNQTAQFYITQLENEKAIASKQASWFESEMKKQSTEYFTARLTFQNQIANLETQLNQQKLLIDTQRPNVDFQRAGLLQEQVNELQIRVLDQQEEFMRGRDADSKELSTAHKLAELYKKANAEERERNSSLEASISQLKNAMNQSQSSFESTISSLNVENSDLKDKLKAAILKVEETSRKYDEANAKIIKLEGLNQDGFDSTVRLLEPPANLSLVETYSRYQAAVESFRAERHQSQRLSLQNAHLEDQLQQIGSLLAHERQEYSSLQSTHVALSNEHAILQSKLQELDFELLAIRNELNTSKISERRQKQECVDLQQQVRHLLFKQVEGREQFNHENAASQVVSMHLVSFKSIEELQQRNQELLVVTRRLTEDVEEAKEKLRADLTAEFLQREEAALAQLEELKVAHKRQEERTQAALLQLNLLRNIQADNEPMVLRHEGQLSVPSLESEQLSSLLASTTLELRNVRDEFSQYRSEKAESDRLVAQQLETLRVQANSDKMHYVRAQAELDFSSARIKQLEQEWQIYRREVETLQKKNAELSSMLSHFENGTVKEQLELQKNRDLVNQYQVDLANLKIENQSLLSSQLRLSEENTKLSKHQERYVFACFISPKQARAFDQFSYKFAIIVGFKRSRVKKEITRGSVKKRSGIG